MSTVKHEGYQFCAAANLFKNFGGLVMYVKYKAGPSRITIKQNTMNHVWFQCPDREIVLVRNAYAEDSFRPWGHSFDVVIDCTTFNDSVCEAEGLSYVMTNFVHSAEDNHRADANRRISVLSDSGGLQMARGMTNLIHPVELADFYEKNVDAGMCLDLPMRAPNMDVVKRAARLQRHNNELMLNTMKRSELINIFHGSSMEERSVFRSIVEMDDIQRAAIGGLSRQLPLTGVNTVMSLTNTGRRYKHYHILGVFQTEYMPLLVKLANSGWKPHITSDSTSHVQGAINGSYFYQRDCYHAMQRLPIGTNYMKHRSAFRHLPCHCRICRNIKYMDVMAFMPNRFFGFFATHNAFAMSAYTEQLQDAVRHETKAEFCKIVTAQLQRNPLLREVRYAMDFIDQANDTSIERARKVFAKHVGNWKALKEVPKGLFGDQEARVSDSVFAVKNDEYLNEVMTKMEAHVGLKKGKR